ncbi:hypothetical protein Ahy_A09g044497 [Arachis hypogaea]|uniref:Uncharacterized protein n=1 Tax=Arachis hypogaea TaxID=3818 RepID=A0A445BK68_ARAHY|nr:hypothetical protein Ahy_A09g044497 [Arachis hypogaea]
MEDFVFTLDLYHGGRMVSMKGGKEYLGGTVVERLQFDLDEWSLQEIVAALKEVGYTGNAKFWWNKPGVALKDGLRELKSDGDAMRMGNGVEITSNDEDYIPSNGEYSGNDLVEVEVVSQSKSSSEDNRFDDSAADGDHEDHFGFNIEKENQQGQHPNAFGGNSGSLGTDDNNVDLGVGVENNTGGVTEDGAEIDVGDISSGYNTESLDSYDGDSNEPIRRKRYPRYNEADMSVDYEFRLGIEFKSIAEFKEAIKEHALLNGRDIRYVKNDQVRCRVKCKGLGGECPWMAFASKVEKSGRVRLKTLKTCVFLSSRNNPGSKTVAPHGNAPAPAPHGSAPAPTPAKTSTTRSITVSQRGKEMGRGRGGSRPRKSTSAIPAAVVSQPAPPASATTTPPVTAPTPPLLPPVAALDPPLPPPVTAPTLPVTTPAPPLPPPDPRNSTAPPVPLPADPSQPAPAPTRSTTPPLPKTNFWCKTQ